MILLLKILVLLTQGMRPDRAYERGFPRREPCRRDGHRHRNGHRMRNDWNGSYCKGCAERCHGDSRRP